MSADWINEHREQLEMHMAGERPFDEYVMNLRQPHGSFGDYFVMLALSALYHVSFIIYCAKNIGAMTLVNIDGDSVSGACNEVTVVYHPSREHYNSADSNLETITPSVETPGSLACAARPEGATENSSLPAAHGEDNVGVEIDFGFQDDWLPLSTMSYRYRKAIERNARALQRAQQNEGGETTYRLIFGDCGEKENAEEGPSKVSCNQKASASKASCKKKASASRRIHAKGSSKGSSSTATAASFDAPAAVAEASERPVPLQQQDPEPTERHEEANAALFLAMTRLEPSSRRRKRVDVSNAVLEEDMRRHYRWLDEQYDLKRLQDEERRGSTVDHLTDTRFLADTEVQNLYVANTAG